MATAKHSTIQPTALQWRTGYSTHNTALTDYEREYVLDGDDAAGVRARASVRIYPAHVVNIAHRADMDVHETADMLAGFRAALARAEGGAA